MSFSSELPIGFWDSLYLGLAPYPIRLPKLTIQRYNTYFGIPNKNQ